MLRNVANIDAEAVVRFKRELRILTELSDLNVIPILAHGDGTEEDGIWYAMPLAKASLLDVAKEFKATCRRSPT
ncbi:hypothetical protein OH807_21900 [Kitasatospora sp. NBC_01560]|uniref:hypothetical protein n=1 Tax=Kitasatospora sp. NBC_01560 TaxID=2975965 RepID=UPI00386C56AD